MATKRKITKTVKRKPKRKTRAERRSLDDIHYGPEPDVDYFNNSKNSLIGYFNWYNYMWDRKTAVNAYIKYAKSFGYKNANKLNKIYFPAADAYLAVGLERGVNFPKPKQSEKDETGTQYYHKKVHDSLKTLMKKINNVEFQKENIDKNLVVKKRKTVQQNIENKLNELLGEVDHAVDMWDVQPFSMYDYLTTKEVSAVIAKKIPEDYQTLVDELNETLEGKDKQLKEAYSYMDRNKLKSFLSFVITIQTDSIRYADMHKPVRKPRKAKQISATKRVEKLNFLKEDVDNKITSIDPSKIIGSDQLWIYNVKTNEITVYESYDRGGLNIKGTSVKNFDEKSVTKKLGVKTNHFIDRILDGGKIVLNKVIDEVNSKASTPTGRINNNMILLKVV